MIELSHIEKRFGDNHVLRDISLTLAEGTVTALVGPSGGGKSTLLRCINLLEVPTSGAIRLGEERIEFAPGRKVGWEAIQKLRRQTGMVFQNFQLFPHQTAIGNVMEGLVTVLKWPAGKARARAMELLEKVGMAHKAGSYPREMSGGEQQRVAIARALALNPPLILADEPTGNLDEDNAERVLQVLLDACSAQGCALVMVTHSVKAASHLNHRLNLADHHLAGHYTAELSTAENLAAHAATKA